MIFRDLGHNTFLKSNCSSVLARLNPAFQQKSPSIALPIKKIRLGNEWAVVHGSLQSRFSFQVLTALRALHCNQVYEQGFLHPASPKIKYCIGHLAPVEALPCSDEVSRIFGKVYKRKTGRNLLFCTSIALPKK